MVKERNKTVIDKIWDLFASVKLAVVIFTLIGLSSVVGTIIEQNVEPEKNIQLLSRMLGIEHETAHSVLGVLDKLGFTDMYHSWWFLAFLLLFAANLIICSLDRLPRVLKLVREKVRAVPLDYLEKVSIKRTFSRKEKASEMKQLAVSSLNSLGFKPRESAGEQGTQLYAEKGNFTRLGVYITHLSILIILAGAILGVLFGYNAVLNLPEGETSSFAYKDRETKIPLGFDLRCDNFEVEYYPGSDMPKAYRSWLTVLKDGKEVLKKSIVVNDPLTYNGITFYQSSFGTVPGGVGNGTVVLRVVSSTGQAEQINTKIGGSFTIPGTSVTGRITNFSPALSIDESGKAFTYAEQMSNPAIYVEFSNTGKAGWILKRYPQTWALPDGNRVEFLDYWGVEYTGMQVRKDPGVLIVYLGCILMALGLYMTFFMSHKRIWVNISEEKSNVKVLIGASVNKNRAAFEGKIEKLVGMLNAGQKGGK